MLGETETLWSEAGTTVTVTLFETAPRTAVTVALQLVPIKVPAFTAKVAEVEPTGTVTLPGTLTSVLLEDSPTTAPPLGAAPLKVTVPTAEDPVAMALGETVRLTSVTGRMVRVADKTTPPPLAVIVTGVNVATVEVDIVKVAEMAPDATVTDAGTVAAVLLDDKLMSVPPGPAGPSSVTVPVEEAPPLTDVGEMENPFRTAGVTVKLAVFVLVPSEAVTVADVEDETAEVVTVKVAEVEPAVTVTDDGTVTLVLLEDRLTLVPPEGATVPSVTVPVDELPP